MEGFSSERKNLPSLLRRPLKQNKAALRQTKKGRLKERWKSEWDASARAEKFKPLDLITPLNKYIKLISDDRLSRSAMSHIFQLQTGHVPLNMYLERIKKAEKPNCPACGHTRENVQHFLFNCPSYGHERWALLKQCKQREPKSRDIFNCAEMVMLLANYIQATARFKLERPGGEEERGGERREERRIHNSHMTTPQHEGWSN